MRFLSVLTVMTGLGIGVYALGLASRLVTAAEGFTRGVCEIARDLGKAAGKT